MKELLFLLLTWQNGPKQLSRVCQNIKIPLLTFSLPVYHWLTSHLTTSATNFHLLLAVFKQPDNVKWLDPFRENIRYLMFQHFGLYDAGGVNADFCQRWLEAGQKSMQCLAISCALTFGISPGQHHCRMFFDSMPAETWSLWLLQNQLLIWTNPIAQSGKAVCYQ